jgi:acyl-ACP thioesterase
MALSENQKQFQASVNEAISKIAKLNEEVYNISSENKKMIETVEKDLSETKLKGIKVRRSIIRNNTFIGNTKYNIKIKYFFNDEIVSSKTINFYKPLYIKPGEKLENIFTLPNILFQKFDRIELEIT